MIRISLNEKIEQWKVCMRALKDMEESIEEIKEEIYTTITIGESKAWLKVLIGGYVKNDATVQLVYGGNSFHLPLEQLLELVDRLKNVLDTTA
jgi:hypothetical protein